MWAIQGNSLQGFCCLSYVTAGDPGKLENTRLEKIKFIKECGIPGGRIVFKKNGVWWKQRVGWTNTLQDERDLHHVWESEEMYREVKNEQEK